MYYRCDLCGQAFTRGDSVKRHKSGSHEMKTSKCGNCGMIFTRKDNLQRHRKRCGDEEFVSLSPDGEVYEFASGDTESSSGDIEAKAHCQLLNIKQPTVRRGCYSAATKSKKKNAAAKQGKTKKTNWSCKGQSINKKHQKCHLIKLDNDLKIGFNVSLDIWKIK